jgi:hypothetical protein
VAPFSFAKNCDRMYNWEKAEVQYEHIRIAGQKCQNQNIKEIPTISEVPVQVLVVEYTMQQITTCSNNCILLRIA